MSEFIPLPTTQEQDAERYQAEQSAAAEAFRLAHSASLTTDRTALATLREAVREYFTAEDAWHGLVCADADSDALAVASRRCTIAADLARALTADHEEGGT